MKKGFVIIILIASLVFVNCKNRDKQSNIKTDLFIVEKGLSINEPIVQTVPDSQASHSIKDSSTLNLQKYLDKFTVSKTNLCLPKVVLNDIILVSPEEIDILGYELDEETQRYLNVRIALVGFGSIDTIFSSLSLAKEGEEINLNPMSEVQTGYELLINKKCCDSVMGAIIFQKKSKNFGMLEYIDFSTDTIRINDPEAGDCGELETTFQMKAQSKEELMITYKQYSTLIDTGFCKIDFDNYDEFLTYSRVAYVNNNGIKYETGLFWNSPLGYATE